jgi:ACT domain-containing protein
LTILFKARSWAFDYIFDDYFLLQSSIFVKVFNSQQVQLSKRTHFSYKESIFKLAQSKRQRPVYMHKVLASWQLVGIG